MTSINLVLFGEGREVDYVSYVKNAGQPLTVVRQEMAERFRVLIEN